MMQTDVKSAHAQNTGLLVTQSPVRLKSITVTSGTASPRNVAYATQLFKNLVRMHA
jgi:hypothetical protein